MQKKNVYVNIFLFYRGDYISIINIRNENDTWENHIKVKRRLLDSEQIKRVHSKRIIANRKIKKIDRTPNRNIDIKSFETVSRTTTASIANENSRHKLKSHMKNCFPMQELYIKNIHITPIAKTTRIVIYY